MYILDKNQDFYDHFSKIYGEDKAVTFDRRGSVILDGDMIVNQSYQYYEPRLNDEKFVLLEIGYTQYLIKLFNFKIKKEATIDIVKSYSMELVRKFEDYKHYYDSYISIRGCDVNYHWDWGWKKHNKGRRYKTDESFKEAISKVYKEIDLPIFANTKITSLIDAKDIWIEMQTYISSLGNDKDVSLPMSEVEKAEIHGFDKKTSFRNPIK